MSLPRFSVRQTVLVNVLFFVCMLGGWVTFQRIPVEYFPEITLNTAYVTTVWSGASADDVERLVTQKLEEEISTISDIQEMRSTSIANLSEIIVDFDENLGPLAYEAALNDLRTAVDRVDDLPTDAEQPALREVTLSEVQPVVFVAIVDESQLGETALREVARDVRKRLEDIPGTRRAQIRGEREREIRVLVDRDAASRYGLTVSEVVERIRRQNLSLPAGTLETASGESTLRARGDYQSIEELLVTVVRENPGGTYVRLGEIARVEDGLEKRRFATRYNGQPALLVSVTKQVGYDVIELVDMIDAWIEEYRALVPDGVSLHTTLDTAAFVAPRIRTLMDNLITGIAFVVAILWFTIGFRNAMLTTIAIPFSFLTAMILFPVLDITINSTTLIALLLVSGLLVDDAIIVLENIYRRIETGEPLREAVTNGTQEVMWPVVCAVSTTCAAFLPLLLIDGTAGKFVSLLPKAVVVCLLASLFECLVILPAHYMDFGSRQRRREETAAYTTRGGFIGGALRVGEAIAAFRRRVESGVFRLRDAYARALDVVLAHRFSFMVLTLAGFVASAGAWKHLPVELFPGEYDNFNVLLETPSEASLDQTDAVAREIEAELAAFIGADITDFSTTVGESVDSNYDNLTGPNLARILLVMTPNDENRFAPDSVLARVREPMERYRDANADRIAELAVLAEQDGPPIGPPVEVRIRGEDYALGKAIAGEIEAYLETRPGVYNIEDNLKTGPEEVRLVVNEERAARRGLRFEDLARALRGANDGIVASSFRDPGLDEDIDIRVLLAAPYRRDLFDLLETELRTPDGELLKLRDVADVEITRGFRSYRRYDAKRTVSVYADVDQDVTSSVSVNRALQARFADIGERYPEVEVSYGGEFEETQEAFGKLFAVMPIAFLGIYMILAALFRSYLQPLIVIIAIPFGFIGIIAGVGVMGYSVSFILFYATIGLTGVVVNDSLVMVDFINRARRNGMPLLEAVRQSGAQRFRPILLTTLTTVSALLPMALGLQGSSKTYGPFAAAISFGLLFAMAGTLFAVPLAYTSLIIWQERLGSRWRALLGRDAEPLRDVTAPSPGVLDAPARRAADR